MSITVRRMGYALGAEVAGVDLRAPLDPQSFREIHGAFLKHHVLVFRDQPITREQHIAFSRWFGTLDDNARQYRDRHPQHPEIILNSSTNEPAPGGRPVYAAEVWHSDASPRTHPALASLLRAVEIPEVGGDTLFSNLHLAYETLSDGMKELISNLHGIYVSKLTDDSTARHLAETRRTPPAIAHPVVRVHPETGRKALYIAQKVQQFVSMTVEESKPLAGFLLQHASRPQFIYRHRWRKHDLLVWDNRCTNHMAVGDYDKSKTRHLERTTTLMPVASGYALEAAA
jgi:taurine dioxygenase